MQKPILIHNPRCSKSCSAKKILDERSIDYVTVDYLLDGIDENLLLRLPKLLELPYESFTRPQEKEFLELDLQGIKLSDKEWIDILLKYPVLIERPIFINSDKAIIGRPPEQVLTIL